MALFPPPHLRSGAHWKGMTVGLLGGSFNPAHEGHVHLSELALKYLPIDCIWWMITPKNPLKKDKIDLKPYKNRMTEAKKLTKTNKRIIITDIERQINSNYTHKTLKILKKRFPQTHFMWIGGTDHLLNLHQWAKWKDLDELVSMHLFRRAPKDSFLKNTPAKRMFNPSFQSTKCKNGRSEPRKNSLFLDVPTHAASSTSIRETRTSIPESVAQIPKSL